MKRLFAFLLVLCFISSFSYSQEVKIVGHIISSADSLPVENVNIVVKGTNRGISSNKEGNFTLKNIKLPCVLKLSHLIYLQKEISLTKRDVSKNNTISLNIQLNEKVSSLSEIVIRDKLSYSLERLVYDFEVDDNNLYLICNKKDKKQLQVYTFEDYKRRTQKIPKECNELGYDLHKNLYAKHENNSDYWLISTNDTILKHRDYDSVLVGIERIIPNPKCYIANKSDVFFTWYNEIHLNGARPADILANSVANYIGSLKNGVYFSYDNFWLKQHKQLYRIYEEKGQLKYRMIYYTFYDIDDWLMPTIKPSAYKYNITNKIVLDNYEMEQLRLIKKSSYILTEYLARKDLLEIYGSTTTPICVYFKVAGEYLYIFNFEKCLLYTLDKDNILLSIVNIDPIFKDELYYNIMFNTEANRCFIIYEKGVRTSLKEIDLTTGRYLKTITLKEPKVEKIRIVKKYMYYTVALEGLYGMERQLYKQKLD